MVDHDLSPIERYHLETLPADDGVSSVAAHECGLDQGILEKLRGEGLANRMADTVDAYTNLWWRTAAGDAALERASEAPARLARESMALYRTLMANSAPGNHANQLLVPALGMRFALKDSLERLCAALGVEKDDG